MIVVLGLAANVDRAVDRGRAANHAAARIDDGPAAVADHGNPVVRIDPDVTGVIPNWMRSKEC